MAQMNEIHPGDIIAQRYRVNAVLGRGRGLLLDAAHTAFEQRVVVRVISPALADAKAVDRFQRETRILSQLETEHVARIIDVGTLPNGSLFLVREYLDGVSISAHAQSVKMGLTASVDLFLQVCEAVQEAHSRGVVLRDLQAAHVFLTHKRNGEPVAKITDFGTCKVMRKEDTDEQSCTKLLGLSTSASPELIRQMKQIDERADVWSLGCMLYEMLTGSPAFQGDGAMLMLAIANEDPVPPSSHRRDINIPAAVDAAVMRALTKSRSKRFQTVYQLAAALRPYASARGQLLIDQIARLAGEEPPRSVEPVSVSPASSSDEYTMTFSRNLRPSEPPASHAAGAPFPIAAPSSQALVQPPPQPSVAEPVAAHVEPQSAPQPFAAASGSASVPSLPGAQYGVHASSFAHASYPPVVADAAEQTADFDLYAMQPQRRLGRKAMFGAAIALTPIAVVLFIYALTSSTPSPEVARSGWDIPSAEQVVAQVGDAEETSSPAASEADAEDEAVAEESAEPSDDEDPVAEEEPVASARAGQTHGSPRRSNSSGSSQFLDSFGSDAKKPSKKRTSKGKSSKKSKKAEKSDKGKKGKGTLVAMAVGASCNFAIDGAGRGASSSVRVQVAAGRHNVSCQPVGGSRRSKSVMVKPGEAAVAVFKF
jgi:serine/threonine-protein kinase